MVYRLVPAALLAAALSISIAHAQPMEQGARLGALGGAGAALGGSVWSTSNPAGWATRQSRALGFFASEAFGLDELRTGAVAVTQPFRWGTVAAGARTFGFEDYRESVVTLGGARGFELGTRRRFWAGAALHAHHLAITDYGAASAVSLSAGWLVALLPALDVGFHATNLAAAAWREDEPLEQTLTLGFAYRPDERVRVLVDGVKEVRAPFAVCGGVEAWLVPQLAVRTGYATAPARFTAGVGLRLGLVRADVARERHEALGWTTGLSFGVGR